MAEDIQVEDNTGANEAPNTASTTTAPAEATSQDAVTPKEPPTKAEQREAAAEDRKKGSNIVLMTQDKNGNFKSIVGVGAGLRTEKDVRDWMVETDFQGEIFPVRPLKPIKREVVSVAKFS